MRGGGIGGGAIKLYWTILQSTTSCADCLAVRVTSDLNPRVKGCGRALRQGDYDPAK